MSPEVVPCVYYLLIVSLVTLSKASTRVLPEDCLEFDIAELEDYLSKYNLENVPTVDTMIGGFKCPVTALPFGALKSDWSRLLLLQRAQPKESIFQEKLGRLFRILAIAYFRMEERFDFTVPGSRSASSVIASSTHKSTTSTDSRKETKGLDTSTIDSRETDQAPASFPTSTSVFNNEEPTDAVEIQRTTLISSNLTMGEKQHDFDSILRDVSSSTTLAFSPVDDWTVLQPSEEVDEKKRVSAFANITTFSDEITWQPKYTAIPTGRIETTNIFNSSLDDFIPVSTKDQCNEDKDDSVVVKSVEFQPVITDSISISTVPIARHPTVTDVSRITTGREMSEGNRKSISSSKFNGRGDFPPSNDDSDFDSRESEDENSLDIFHVQTTTELSRVYSDKISAKGTVSSVESFNESRSSHRTDAVPRVLGKVPWDSSNSTSRGNESGTPRRPPWNDRFWKYIAPSREVTSTTIARPRLVSRTDPERGKENLIKSRKRGSLNTNVEKNFRWFYNFGYENGQRSRDNPVGPGVYIECDGKRQKRE